ncbi:hypothetical protein C4F50_23465 [Flavobacterium sp. KB82]|uniref:Transposase n=1 Tax=Flavobacterium hungaricum TaxID=2082725 RepID=A0ABR9TR88_9FLAO|nr:hypothetical protein [Flavobacterium hungaricum]
MPFKNYLVNGKNKIFIEIDVKNFNFITILKEIFCICFYAFAKALKTNQLKTTEYPMTAMLFG